MTRQRWAADDETSSDLLPVEYAVVDIAPIDTDPADPAAGEETVGMRRPPRRAARGWSRGFVIAAVSASCAALVVAGVALRWRGREVLRTHTVVPTVTADVDASGCPVTSVCGVSPNPDVALVDAVQDAFPGAPQLIGNSVFESATGRTYRSVIVLRTNVGTVVSVSAQCVPGGRRIAARHDLPALGPADAIIVVPGQPGCAVTVVAHVSARVPVPIAAMERIAGGRGVQISG